MLKLILKFIFRKKTPKTKKTASVSDPKSKINELTPTPVGSKLDQQENHGALQKNDSTISGACYVIDGDTIQIGKIRLRLAGIDAPELDHPWGQKAKWELINMCKGQKITARLEPNLSYDRLVATCFIPDGKDLSADMVRRGMALDWPKFSGGKYAKLEPEGIRKKHWKAAARQRGHMHIFNK